MIISKTAPSANTSKIEPTLSPFPCLFHTAETICKFSWCKYRKSYSSWFPAPAVDVNLGKAENDHDAMSLGRDAME